MAQLVTMPLTQQHGTKAPLPASGKCCSPPAGSVCSTMTFTAALWKWQCTLVEIRPFEPIYLWLMEKVPNLNRFPFNRCAEFYIKIVYK
jgi:hypothetical protein